MAMSEKNDRQAPDRVFIAWPNDNGCGLAFTVPSKAGQTRTEFVRADLLAPSAPACYTVSDCLIDVSGANYRAIAKDSDGNLLGENDTGEHIMFSSSHVHLEGLHILSPEALESVISNRISELAAPAEVEGLVAALIKADRGHDPGTLFTEAAAALTALQAENERLREAADASDGNDIWRFWNGRAKAFMDRAHDLQARAERAESERDALAEALRKAEAALSDIGDAEREPGDDLAWCERRAAEAIPIARTALAKLEGDV